MYQSSIIKSSKNAEAFRQNSEKAHYSGINESVYKKSNIPTYLLQMGDTFNEGLTIFPFIFPFPNQIEKKDYTLFSEMMRE